VPIRSYAYNALLDNEQARQKLVHGSDWPIAVIPPTRVGLRKGLRLVAGERNWLRRDVHIKQALGFDEAYWRRAATILRLQPKQPAT
jgi:hypothetical protein